jgi:hypothetical protein
MYMVYWSEFEGENRIACSEGFDTAEMKQALSFMEDLRARQRAGAALGFVALCSEHPHSVGPSGVAEAGPDYNWKKRRR